jgi:TPR repeat protein
MKPLVAAVAVLVALVVGVQAQTPEYIDALRARAEQGNARAQFNLGFRYANGQGVPED